jgi:hypothetical protein
MKRQRLVIHDDDEEEEDDRIVMVDQALEHNTGIDAHTRGAEDFNSNDLNNTAENVADVTIGTSSLSNNNDGSHILIQK